MPAESVDALLDEVRFVSEDQYAVVQAVRSLASSTLGPIDEEVKYGGILFSSSGVPFGGVFAYKQHVSVEFSNGVAIDDPYGHLEGAGKGRRHVKLRSIDDIESKRLAAYLPLALQASAGVT